MARQLTGEAGGGKGRCVGSLWVTLVTISYLRVSMGHLRVTIGHVRVTEGHPWVTIGHLRVTKGIFFL